jgi:hypothetical protein
VKTFWQNEANGWVNPFAERSQVESALRFSCNALHFRGFAGKLTVYRWSLDLKL